MAILLAQLMAGVSSEETEVKVWHEFAQWCEGSVVGTDTIP